MRACCLVLILLLLVQVAHGSAQEHEAVPIVEKTATAPAENSSQSKARLYDIGIYVTDLERTEVFYKQVFGFKVVRRWTSMTTRVDGGEEQSFELPGIFMKDAIGTTFEFLKKGKPENRRGVQEPINHFAIHVNDVKATLERAQKAGAKLSFPNAPIQITRLGDDFAIEQTQVIGLDGERIQILRELKSESSVAVASLPPRLNVVQRIGFGSCAKHWQHQPIWEAVIATNPDFFVFLGDAIYADTDGKTAWTVTEKQLQGEWNRLADKPEYQRFRANVPIMATWDNHDYGSHNGGAEFELKKVSKRIFLNFFGEPQHSERRKRAGIYDAKVFGPEGRRVQIILLDTRTFRGPFKRDLRSKQERTKTGKVGGYLPHENARIPILGDAQWDWLETQLRTQAELRLVCSSTQIIPDKKGMDEWGCFPHERQRLFDLIQTTQANGVILLTGNVHFAEISQVETKTYPLLDFTSSGLTHINETYANAANSYRVAGPLAELNFGIVEIDWSAKPSAQVTLKAIAGDGSTGFTHRVSLDALR